MCIRDSAYTNHTILAEALEKWPVAYLEKVVPHLMPVIRELDARVKKDYSDEAGQLLRIYQQYFMVSNAAQLILKEAEDNGYDLYRLYDHVAIQINDTHPRWKRPSEELSL